MAINKKYTFSEMLAQLTIAVFVFAFFYFLFSTGKHDILVMPRAKQAFITGVNIAFTFLIVPLFFHQVLRTMKNDIMRGNEKNELANERQDFEIERMKATYEFKLMEMAMKVKTADEPIVPYSFFQLTGSDPETNSWQSERVTQYGTESDFIEGMQEQLIGLSPGQAINKLKRVENEYKKFPGIVKAAATMKRQYLQANANLQLMD